MQTSVSSATASLPVYLAANLALQLGHSNWLVASKIDNRCLHSGHRMMFWE